MAAYIEFKNVVKRFGDFTALDHVSLEIPKGSFVTLLVLANAIDPEA